MSRRAAWVPALAGLLLCGGAAAEAPLPVVRTEAPWSSLVYVTTNIGTRCTGAVVGPTRVLTAAHCLVNRKTQKLLQAVSLHVVFGYDRGDFAGHILVARYAVPPSFDPAQPGRTPGADWAVLELTSPAGRLAPPLPLALAPPPGETPAALVGFRRDKAHILTGDLDCRLLGPARHVSGAVLMHDCASLAGQSGAPLLARTAEGWVIAGIHVGYQGAGRGVAVPAASVQFDSLPNQ